MKGYLTIEKLREIINNPEYDNHLDALVCVFNINDGTRHDLEINSIDNEWLDENNFIDINVEGL